MARSYRFFIEDAGEKLGSDLRLGHGIGDEILHQLTKVLRVSPGDRIVLLDGGNRFGEAGMEFLYDVESANKKEIQLKFVEKNVCVNELDSELKLVLCLPNKPDKLSFILQKAVEIGVSQVVLVDGENSQMKHELKRDRLERIMKEAAEQSERAYIPELEISGGLIDCLREVDKENLFVAMEREDGGGLDYDDGSCSIVIGPEGGFSEKEKEFINDHGVKTFSLGKRILRMETATVVALGLAALR